MDRRTFLVQVGGTLATVSLGGCAVSRQDSGARLQPGRLDADLAALASPRFSTLAGQRNRTDLYRQLTQRGIISVEGGVSQSRLRSLAEREPVVIYRDFYYTRTELDLYALAFLSQPAGLGL